MFDTTSHRQPSPEVIARFDELFERRHPTRTAESSAFTGSDRRVVARAKSCCGARPGGGRRVVRLTVVALLRNRGLGRRDRVRGQRRGSRCLADEPGAGRQARTCAMPARCAKRLPKLAEVFRAGDIDRADVRHRSSIRTDLITDPDVLARWRRLRAGSRGVRWPSMTRGRLAGHIDRNVAKADADAVRRRTERSHRAGRLMDSPAL